MNPRKTVLFSLIVISLTLGACVPAKPDAVMMGKPTEAVMEKPTQEMMAEPTETMMEKPTDAMMEKTSTDAMMDSTATPGNMMDETTAPEDTMVKPTEGAMMAAPAWFGVKLTDVTTGETFAINDFKGKVVLVELMAQWCSTCKKQQLQVKTLHEQLGMPADLITLALDIDPNEKGETLKTYAADNSFDWMYAISPADVSREIGNLYGDQFLNPPSAPILLIDRKGEVHPLPFGIKSAEDLMKAIEPYLKAM
jgi:thiol-disulfide isomerase/thioredoxin